MSYDRQKIVDVAGQLANGSGNTSVFTETNICDIRCAGLCELSMCDCLAWMLDYVEFV